MPKVIMIKQKSYTDIAKETADVNTRLVQGGT